MADLFLDCDTKDLERLQPVTNRLMIAFQQMQVEATKDLPIRDQMIVIIASLNHLNAVAEKTTKRMTTPRFIRSIKSAVQVARQFGTGRLFQKSE
jgi:hypothetical protein